MHERLLCRVCQRSGCVEVDVGVLLQENLGYTLIDRDFSVCVVTDRSRMDMVVGETSSLLDQSRWIFSGICGG